MGEGQKLKGTTQESLRRCREEEDERLYHSPETPRIVDCLKRLLPVRLFGRNLVFLANGN